MNITKLINYILFGDFGLLTSTPRYLFGVLLPIMFFLQLFTCLLSISKKYIYFITGLGCTTVAIASLSATTDKSYDKSMFFRVMLILIFIIPCSSQLAVIVTFAAMVSIDTFICYIFVVLLIMFTIYTIIIHFTLIGVHNFSSSHPMYQFPPRFNDIPTPKIKSLRKSLKSAFSFVLESALPFTIGSLFISLAGYFGIFDILVHALAPVTENFLHLPENASELLILNIIKRDFGSAYLLSLMKNCPVTACQLIVIMTMLTFTVPCINSSIILFKQEKLHTVIFIWLGSFLLSLFIGKMTDVFLIYLF